MSTQNEPLEQRVRRFLHSIIGTVAVVDLAVIDLADFGREIAEEAAKIAERHKSLHCYARCNEVIASDIRQAFKKGKS